MRKPRSNSWVSTPVSSLTGDDQRPHTSTEISPSSKHRLHFSPPETSSAAAGIANLRGDRGDGCLRKADQSDPHCSKGSHTFDRHATEQKQGKNLQEDCSSNPRPKPKPSVSFVNPDPVLRSSSPFPLYDGVLRSGSPYPKPEWFLKQHHHTPSKSPMFLRSQSPFARSELSLKADTPLGNTSPSTESVLRSGSPYPNPESRPVKSVHSSTSLFNSSERSVYRSDGSSTSSLYKHNIIKRYMVVQQKGGKIEKSQSSTSLTPSVCLDNNIGHYLSTPSCSSFMRTKQHIDVSIYASKTLAPPILKSSPFLKDCSQKKAPSAKRKTVTYQDQPGNALKRPNKNDAGKKSTKNVRLPEVVGEAPRGLSPTDHFDDEDEDDDEFDDEEDLLTDDEDEDDDDEYEESLENSEKEKEGKIKTGKKRKDLTDLKNTLGWDQTTVIVVVVFVFLRLLMELFFSDSERLASFFSQPKNGEALEDL